MDAFLVWIVVTAALFAGLVVWRESHLHRRLRLTDIHWKAAILLAALIALVPAFLFDHFSRDEVEVPAGVAERAGVPVAAPKSGE
jgi:glucan phosphoethanolaminetransferase (alkaline phosphatase superfamily)